MEWIRLSPYNLPPQGLKIVCFRKGDLWIARRLRYKGQDYWLEFAYGGNDGSICTDAPDYWMKLDLLEGCTGFMLIGVNNEEPVTLDVLEERYPDNHQDFVGMLLLQAKKRFSK